VRYASATGTGSAPCTASARCPVATALAAAVPGDVVELLGSTMTGPVVYRGGSAMIDPPTGASGKEGRPITVRCSVDGGCLLDGQFKRIPIRLARNNDWWVVEGITAKNGSQGLVSVRGSNNIVRRVVAWDAQFDAPNGSYTFSCFGGVNNLFEDVAGFGIATWIFTHSQNREGPCTFRRAWGRFEGTADGRRAGATFGGLFYNAYRSTCDNCLAELAPNTGLTRFTVIHPTPTSETGCPNRTCTDGAPPIPNSPINQSRMDPPHAVAPTNDFDGFVGGSLVYVRAPANLSRMLTTDSTAIQGVAGAALMYMAAGRRGGNITFKDVLWIVDPSHPQFDHIRALNLKKRDYSSNMYLTNVSTVAGAVDIIDTSAAWKQGAWVTSNLVHATSLAGLNSANANPWTGTAGANLCYRYVNRVRQDGTAGTIAQPLWPWPMNDRIRAATAAAGAYSGPCTGCVGTFPTRTETDVTAIVEELLGPIPASCRQ
jgi:hypothetical protein